MAVLRLNCRTCRQCLLRFGVGNEYFNDPVKYVSFSVYNIIFVIKCLPFREIMELKYPNKIPVFLLPLGGWLW